MAYATTTQINALLGPHAATANTDPTLTELGTINDGIAAQIDTVLKGTGVSSVPVSSGDDSTFAAYLTQVNMWGAAAQYLLSAFPEVVAAGRNTSYNHYIEQYNAALAAFREGKDIPAALLGGSNDPSPSSYFTRNPEQEETLGTLAGAHLTKMGDTF